MIGWKLWYDSGWSVTSDDLPWSLAPKKGVQVFMRYFADGTREIITGEDEYEHEGAKKYGRWMDEEKFMEIQLAAMSDRWRPSIS